MGLIRETRNHCYVCQLLALTNSLQPSGQPKLADIMAGRQARGVPKTTDKIRSACAQLTTEIIDGDWFLEQFLDQFVCPPNRTEIPAFHVVGCSKMGVGGNETHSVLLD